MAKKKEDYDIIIIKNNSNVPLKVLLLTEQTKYQTQTPREVIRKGGKKNFIIPSDFSRLILSKD